MSTRRRVVVSSVGALSLAAAVALSTSASAGAQPFAFQNTALADQGAYGEPSIAVADDGKHIAVCVPGGAGDTSVWYSGDKGRTFGTSHTNTSSGSGGGDCEIDYLPNGTLLNADLEITDSDIHYSKDFGKTWQGSQTAGLEQDRQWFAHSKDGKKAYLVYHDFVAEGEFYAQSNDGGLTWDKADAAHPVNNTDQASAPGAAGTQAPGQPASLLDQGANTFSGPMLISPDGRDTYVMYSISDLQSNTVGTTTPPYGATRGIVVAHKGSEDSGFTNDYAVADSDATNGAIFPWGAVDNAGNVYVLYNSDKGSRGHFHTYYVFSTDKAKTWSKPVKVDGAPLAQGAQVYATGDAGAAGVLDIAWYGADKASGADDKTAAWTVHFAQVRGATSKHPSIARSVVSPGVIHRGDICLNGLLCETGGDRSLLDFFELQIGADGMAYIAYANNAGFGSTPSTGLVGSHTGAINKNGRVVFARQTRGKSAYAR